MDKEIWERIVFMLLIAAGCLAHGYTRDPMAKGLALFVALFGVAMFSAHPR